MKQQHIEQDIFYSDTDSQYSASSYQYQYSQSNIKHDDQSQYLQSTQLQLKQKLIKIQNNQQNQLIQNDEKVQKNRNKNNVHAHIQKLIKQRIQQKICDINNKLLYPDLMGPHPMFTVENGCETKQVQITIDLKKQLAYWKRKFLKVNAVQSRYNKLIYKQQKVKKQAQEQQSNANYSKNNIRIGLKYKKYSLQFKKNVVNKIQQQMNMQGAYAKSLRYYVMKQAELLHIHPKNITRWFDTKDLDRKQGGRKAKFPILQYNLAKFMKQNPQCKRRQVVQKAKKLLKQTGEVNSFQFSKGWYQRFRIRLRKNKVSRSMQSLIYDQNNINKDLTLREDNKTTKINSIAQFLSNSKNTKNKEQKFGQIVKLQFQHQQNQNNHDKQKNQDLKIKREEQL